MRLNFLYYYDKNIRKPLNKKKKEDIEKFDHSKIFDDCKYLLNPDEEKMIINLKFSTFRKITEKQV